MDEVLKIFICDDELNCIKSIEKAVRKYLVGKCEFEITCFDNGDDLINSWKRERADVILLDIEMSNISGFEVAEELQKIKKDICIIFITSHEDRVYDSWVYQPFWFVRKKCLSDLKIVLDKLILKIEFNKNKYFSLVRINVDSRIVEIDLNTVLTIESQNHNILIRDRKNGDVVVRGKISAIEQQLERHHVIRIQKGIMVNCRAIAKITSRNVYLTDNSEYSIGRDRIESAKQKYQEYLRLGDI